MTREDATDRPDVAVEADQMRDLTKAVTDTIRQLPSAQCGHVVQPCTADAAAFLVTEPCGHSGVPGCAPHALAALNETRMALAAAERLGRTVMCRCGKTVTGITVRKA